MYSTILVFRTGLIKPVLNTRIVEYILGIQSLNSWHSAFAITYKSKLTNAPWAASVFATEAKTDTLCNVSVQLEVKPHYL